MEGFTTPLVSWVATEIGFRVGDWFRYQQIVFVRQFCLLPEESNGPNQEVIAS